MKNIFKINILEYLVFILLILSGYINYLVIYLFIITIHEFGHIILIKLFGYRIIKINFNLFGGSIVTNINLNINSFHLFLISFGGIFNQLLLFLLIKDNGSYNYDIFRNLNTTLILFNLLPVYPLDGYKILISIIEQGLPYKKSLIISYIISFIGCFLFSIYNYFILILLIDNIIYIKSHKYHFNKFLLERYLYPPKYHKLVSINNINNLYKTKYNYINCVNEEYYLNMYFKR